MSKESFQKIRQFFNFRKTKHSTENSGKISERKVTWNRNSLQKISENFGILLHCRYERVCYKIWPSSHFHRWVISVLVIITSTIFFRFSCALKTILSGLHFQYKPLLMVERGNSQSNQHKRNYFHTSYKALPNTFPKNSNNFKWLLWIQDVDDGNSRSSSPLVI